MRILYIDIDSLRADHLGCYGYVRQTSPTIDGIASRGVRFSNCYASDMPCAPSRMALFSGRFGHHNGVVSHFGRRAEPYPESRERGFRHSPLTGDMLAVRLRDAGMKTATLSPFAARHGLFSILAGFHDCHDPGGHGHGGDGPVTDEALRWLDQHGSSKDWFLHINYWGVHIPYRASGDQDLLFAGEVPHPWLTQDLFDRYARRPGFRSFMDTFYDRGIKDETPWQPAQIDSRDAYDKMINSYDTMIRFTDDRIREVLRKLETLGIADDTVLIVAADHGEDLGENGAVGHGFASHPTGNVPLIVSWPGVTDVVAGAADGTFQYHLDLAATLLDLLGLEIPSSWDSESFAEVLRGHGGEGRDHLVLSHLAQSAQRSVRFDRDGQEYLYSRTWNDLLHDLPAKQLFNLTRDPHMVADTAREDPDLVRHASGLLDGFTRKISDPLPSVLEDGIVHYGPRLERYKQRLCETNRGEHVDLVDRYLRKLKRGARRPHG